MRIDEVGNTQKYYEKLETEKHLMKGLPHVCRIDGKAFHSFCRGLNKPFDTRLNTVFDLVSQALMMETNATLVYHQSDEISLAWTKGITFFEGKVHKMLSVIASMTTYYFNEHKRDILQSPKSAFFDCRVWALPNMEKVTEYFEWREADAIKNSISGAASSVFSHSQLMGKNSNMRKAMLLSSGIRWEDYPDEFKRGVYYSRKTVSTTLSQEELNDLPPHHNARKDPNMAITRSVISKLNIPFLSEIENKEGVLFDGQKAIRRDR